jgi:hypothetical protein
MKPTGTETGVAKCDKCGFQIRIETQKQIAPRIPHLNIPDKGFKRPAPIA